MKKIIIVMLVAFVPFTTLAQKRSKKDKPSIEITEFSADFMVIKGISSLNINAADVSETEAQNYEEGIIPGQQIFFDFGTQPNKEAVKLKEKSRELRSMVDAVNFLSKYGWEFVSADIERLGRVTTNYYYMKKKK